MVWKVFREIPIDSLLAHSPRQVSLNRVGRACAAAENSTSFKVNLAGEALVGFLASIISLVLIRF